MSDAPQIVADTQYRGLMALLPERARDYASLARLDRPIGWWLLFWPCAWGVLLAGGAARWGLLLWLLLGSVVMRGAGCVFNDIVDADIDRRVARTALRPVASGRVSKKAAWSWTIGLCLFGLIVLLQLRWQAQVVALASLALVAAYPFMKRITGWPQAWLGLVFTWGAPVGWVEIRGFADLPVLGALYAGCWAWCMAYDTIYALQDREDDALVGVGSSALSFGRYARAGVAGLYGLAVVCWGAAVWAVRPDPLALLALVPVALHFGWQVTTLRTEDGENALARFRANRFAGLLMALACLVVGAA
ncbi:4-hydroxybenzoate octaprenyltransferase [Novosphingobium sp. FSY-8]|uniref:4-hydroxybenzoate octaprenyltransferase n=1 Tax=Novosphingobium ovatum TaxID=1908523 RepID=A0ABW9XBD7_9SPHN|nr:4-hydroxybenzoate octaprenyltransferase [Novosphingobium ovatum]NBC35847.1 4-hydroxybenzoate octaprenyltransferase [Novosphingobium ovatum]